MSDFVLQHNHIIQMTTTAPEDSDSSNDDIFIELAQAWNFVKKWYNFRSRSDNADEANTSRVKFTRSKSRMLINKLAVREPTSRNIFFQDLPISIKLQIFSHLDVYDLGRAARVCHQWYSLANDAVLWESKLQKDAEKWQVIDHLSHPSLYKETITDLTPKELYLKCCPECHSYRRNRTPLKVKIPRLSFFLGFSTPRVVMFGPGLETETSGIVKRIFSGPNSPFFIKGMFPGQFDGIGSGVSLQYQGGKLDLITLYSACRSERENNALNGIRKNNFIIERNLDDHDVEDDSNIMVTQPVKDLCSTVDAFIYVVDATLNSNKVGIGKDELKAVVGNRWLQPKAPLLVLSCTTEASSKHYSPICVSDVLGLRELNRPWQVRVCHVNNLYGVLPGVQWLIHEVMKS